jgi:ribosomal protein S17
MQCGIRGASLYLDAKVRAINLLAKTECLVKELGAEGDLVDVAETRPLLMLSHFSIFYKLSENRL